MSSYYRSARKNRASSQSSQRSNNRRQRRGFGNLDINKLIHKAKPLIETQYVSELDFSDFTLHRKLQETISHAGYKKPTEIQEKSFEHIIAGRDILGVATTGTGKTAAFLVPMIQRMLENESDESALIMVPTRELALQVEDEFRKLSRGMRLWIASFIGGQPIREDLKKITRFHHVIVGTPGRLKDLKQRGKLKLNNIKTLVLDEFDRMLEMGFSEDVLFLVDQMIQRRQTMLFSATVDAKLNTIISKLLHNPSEIRISSGTHSAEHIEQDIIRVQKHLKMEKLLEMVRDSQFEKVLVFAETKNDVAKTAKELKNSGIRADEIHGDKSQGYRKNALKNFKSGKVSVLVATDVASRGLDISDVTHVINYDIPQNYEIYIHRIGRTGRAGKNGVAYTFVN